MSENLVTACDYCKISNFVNSAPFTAAHTRKLVSCPTFPAVDNDKHKERLRLLFTPICEGQLKSSAKKTNEVMKIAQTMTMRLKQEQTFLLSVPTGNP